MKVALVGVCKNIESTIPVVRLGFEQLSSQLECKGVFYENNSTDNTSRLLKEWSSQDQRVKVVSEFYSNDELLEMCNSRTWDNLPCRMEIIAMARNKVMGIIESEEYDDIDYVIVIDMDSPIPLPVDKIISVIEKYHTQFDALICRGDENKEFYDVYAFRSEEYPLGPEYMGQEFWTPNHHFFVKGSTTNITENFPVYSAFNGLAILRREAIKGIRYSGIPTASLSKFYSNYTERYPRTIIKHENGRLQGIQMHDLWYTNNSGYGFPVVCEHVTFFLEMRSRGYERIYICPELVWNFTFKPLGINMSEIKCTWVSSRGLLKSCHRHNKNPKSSDRHIDSELLDGVKDYDIVHICSWLTITRFVREFVPKLTKKVVIVTNDSDFDAPIFEKPVGPGDDIAKEEILAFLESDLCVHWFTQNCTLTHPKVSPIPIGMDYHTMAGQHPPVEQEQALNQIRNNSPPLEKRHLLCYGNYQFGMNNKYYTQERIDCLEQVPKELCYYEPHYTTRYQCWFNQSQCCFVLSPAGGGMDCHRTWEALLLGCIPILRRLNPAFDKLFDDLPVLMVDKWSDIDEELLKKTIIEFRTRQFNMDKLKLQYWVDKFNTRNSP